MFFAHDENKNRISIEKAEKGKNYFCPICEEKVIVRAKDSLAMKAHFAHQKGTECFDNWKHDMSEWHYNWQCLFPENCREVVVEKDGKKHRADVLINNHVIEFQHSPITAKEISERNNFYLGCNHKVVWVFDGNGKIEHRYEKDHTIDPALCKCDELQWKRARREFSEPMPKDVEVFVEYKIETTTNTESTIEQDQKTEILLYLEQIGSKFFTFHPKQNFTKDTFPLLFNYINTIKTSPQEKKIVIKYTDYNLPKIKNQRRGRKWHL